MTARPANIFIVQTAESNRSGRAKGSQLSLINKQSALYKYRQQKKRKESRSSVDPAQPTSVQSFDTQRTSWLLESRLSKRSPSSRSDCSSSASESEGSGPAGRKRPVAIGDVNHGILDNESQLHDCYAGLRTDPFSCMPIEDSSIVLAVSDLYTNMMIPHISQMAKVFNVHDVYLDIFWAMVFQEDTIDAVVAMSYCADASWRKSAGSAPRKDLFLHQAKSLAILQRKFTEPDASNTGTTICMLMYNCNVARSLGDMKAAKQHMTMIRHLLRNRLSLDTLGYQGKLKSLLMQWEYFLTLGNNEEPLFERPDQPASVYPSLPLQGEFAEIVDVLPNGFKFLAKTGRLSCQVLHVLNRAQEMMTAVMTGTTQAFLATPNGEPYPDFCTAIPCLVSEKAEDSFERLLCCAIFLLTSRMLSPLKWALWSLPATGGRTILTKNIANCQVISDVEKKCLIWMWILVIDSWAIGSKEVPEKALSLMQQLRSRYPETEDWSIASDAIQDFFWTNDLEISCLRYWQKGFTVDVHR